MAVYASNGSRISQSTGLDILLQGDFEIEINDTKYKITVGEDCESLLFVDSCFLFLFSNIIIIVIRCSLLDILCFSTCAISLSWFGVL